MKIPDTITAKVREFREKKATLLDWRPKEPLEIESSDVSQFGQQYSDGQSVWTVVDWRNIETFLEQALLDVRRETIKEGNEELLRAIAMGRVSGNFDVLLYSVTQLYLAREEANTPTV